MAYLRNEGGELRDAKKPFALVVAMNPPHMPYGQVPRKYVERYGSRTWEDLLVRGNIPAGEDSRGRKLARKQIKNYFAMITGVDEQFGRLLDCLDEQGLARDTIVLFTSDHGNCLGAHEQVSKNNHYEESMRVPFLVRWPGEIPARRDELLMSVPDIYPTLLGLMGLAEKVPDEVQGTSHAAIFRGEERARGEARERGARALVATKHGSLAGPVKGLRGSR